MHQLATELGEYPNLVEHHLFRLEDAGLVVVKEEENSDETAVFRADDAALWDDENTRVLFGRRPLRQIGLYISDNPGATSREIAEAMALEPVTIRHHLRNLQDNRLVDKLRVGRRYYYRPKEALDEWVVEVGDGFERSWKR